MWSPKRLGIAAAAALTLLLLLFLGARQGVRSFFYPKPPKLPATVSQSAEELLARLQVVLDQRAPHVARTLRAGISDERIRELEQQGGFQLPPELKAFYRWHNGAGTNGNGELIPMGYFLPLDRVVDERKALVSQLGAASAVQRAAFQTFAGHTKAWLSILPDGAGDGYHFDHERNSFFYNFAETASYHWFPSFRNFLAGVIDCYETGAFFVTNSTDGMMLDQDFARSEKIWSRFGAGKQ